MPSRSFGSKRPKMPHLARRGEIADLRQDIEEAFLELEGDLDGVTANDEVVGKVFVTHATPVTTVLMQVVPNQLITRAAVLVTEAFNGEDMLLSLGVSGDPTMILGAEDTDLATPGQYTSERYSLIDVSDDLVLTLNLGGATAGAAVLLYRVR